MNHLWSFITKLDKMFNFSWETRSNFSSKMTVKFGVEEVYFILLISKILCNFILIYQIKAKTINEIHSEAEKNLGLRPGATASIRNNRAIASSAQGNISPTGYRAGLGGMMPGMPGTRKMPGMPGMDNDNWEVPKSRSTSQAARVQPPMVGKSPSMNQRFLPQGTGGFMGSTKTSALLQGSEGPARPTSYGGPAVDPAPSPVKQAPVLEKPLPPAAAVNVNELKRKTKSLLEEYFSIRLLDEALQCVEELKAPAYHSEFVKEAILLGLEKSPPCVEPVGKLLEYLFSKKVLNADNMLNGALGYAALLEDLAIDLPKAPPNFGEIIGKLVVEGALDLKAVKEILVKVGDDYYQKAIFTSTMKVVSSAPGGKAVMDAQAADIAACESLF